MTPKERTIPNSEQGLIVAGDLSIRTLVVAMPYCDFITSVRFPAHFLFIVPCVIHLLIAHIFFIAVVLLDLIGIFSYNDSQCLTASLLTMHTV